MEPAITDRAVTLHGVLQGIELSVLPAARAAAHRRGVLTVPPPRSGCTLKAESSSKNGNGAWKRDIQRVTRREGATRARPVSPRPGQAGPHTVPFQRARLGGGAFSGKHTIPLALRVSSLR